MEGGDLTDARAIPSLTPDTPLEALSIDPLGVVELLFIVEDQFSVQPSFDGSAHFEPPKLRMLDRVSQFALVAAKQALGRASCDLGQEDRSRIGVFVGTGMGGSQTSDDGYKTLYGDASDRIKPFTLKTSVGGGKSRSCFDRLSTNGIFSAHPTGELPLITHAGNRAQTDSLACSGFLILCCGGCGRPGRARSVRWRTDAKRGAVTIRAQLRQQAKASATNPPEQRRTGRFKLSVLHRGALRMRFNPDLEQSWFGSLMEIINNATMLSIILTGAALMILAIGRILFIASLARFRKTIGHMA
ncbi:hypothetical protein ACCAA_130101 [Candidatus Accumulibacter aalborgensis]|uniref:Beta-ketoacyl synthase-like N-terminal domain-containing protein n=1 Tax=Candidatus Accumulibacter aalborgensis TaxID=1860102 RepID=A0A1A8XG48_9PROT|nr:hypothetical protein ACCAA_130101 [Candidatus Accumulibacter aalborgensis]